MEALISYGFKTAEPRVRFDLEQITGTVPIIKAYAGMGIGDGIISLLDPEKMAWLSRH